MPEKESPELQEDMDQKLNEKMRVAMQSSQNDSSSLLAPGAVHVAGIGESSTTDQPIELEQQSLGGETDLSPPINTVAAIDEEELHNEVIQATVAMATNVVTEKDLQEIAMKKAEQARLEAKERKKAEAKAREEEDKRRVAERKARDAERLKNIWN